MQPVERKMNISFVYYELKLDELTIPLELQIWRT